MGGGRHHHHHHRHRRLLTHNAALVPEGGAAVYAQLTALTRSYAKDAAGHPFHLCALKQAGLYGALGDQRRQQQQQPPPLHAPACTHPRMLHVGSTVGRRGVPLWPPAWLAPTDPARPPARPPAEEPEEETADEASSSEPSRQNSTADFASLDDEGVAGCAAGAGTSRCPAGAGPCRARQ